MKVFVVFSVDSSDGPDLEAVFSTKEKAEEFASTLRDKEQFPDSVEVLAFEVDAL